MSDFEDYDEDEYDNTTGQGLRAQLKKALADKKAREQELDTARQKIAEYVGVEVFKDKVAKPAAVARLASKDGVDLGDEKAVEKWLADNGDLFTPATATQPAAEGDQSEANAAQEQPIPDGVENTFNAINRIHATSQPGMTNKYDTATAALSKDATPEEVLAAYRAAGL